MGRFAIMAALFVVAALGCGDCDDETGTNASTNSATADGGPSDGGNGSNANAGDAGSACGIYSNLCDGECIPTNSDPDNCGDCGVVCGSGEVCFGGRCIEGCSDGLTECDRRCVDLRNSNDHCGMCGDACAAGEGCVESNCVDAIDIDFDAAMCDGGGPVIDLGEVVDSNRQCAGDLAELTFRFGVCSCNDFDINNPLLVDAFDSALGPYEPGGPGGGVGVNGDFVSNNGGEVSGTLWVAGDGGITLNGDLTVGQNVLSGGRFQSSQATSVGQDVTLEGELNVTGTFSAAGILTLPNGATPPDSASYGDLVNRDTDVAEPCTECPPDAIDIAAIVQAFRDPANNDNDLVGLDADVFNPASNAPNRLDLPCGRYYFNGIQSSQALTIVAHGNTAIFVDGDITANNPLTITLTPDAQLDLFVSGNVTINNEFTLGSPDYPALLRAYIGGENGFVANNPVDLGGYLYVVPGTITTNNELEVYGGVYSGDITGNNPWRIHYDRRVATIGRTCPDPDPDPDPDPGDMGMPMDDPTCSTQDDVCMTDDDCCAPLACIEGTCQLLNCVPAFGSCSDNSDCCAGSSCTGADGICVVN